MTADMLRDRAVGHCDGSVDRPTVWSALERVEDPELPLSIVDLGLVRRLDIADGVVVVGLTYTSLACPCVEMIREDVEAAVRTVSGVRSVRVDDVLEPWSRNDVTPEGRELLRAVAVV
ncbi:MAG TPA: metal-sulfur cluster assembly factor [Euzebyales bacterium]|nr:metal-sulfur cluster assembly factor [Euzebyales bacterium]